VVRTLSWADDNIGAPVRLRAGPNFVMRINVIWAVQSHFQKYWRFSPKQITSLVAPSRFNEGRLAIVTNAGRDAVDAVGAFDEWR